MALTLAPLGAMQTAKKWPYSPKVGAAPSLWIDATNTPTNLVSTLSGLVSWFDGKDTSTLALSGSNVTQWSDKSSLGANLTRNPFYTAPTYSSGTNLMSVGSPSNLALNYPGNTFSATSTWAMFFIVNPDPTKPGFLMGTKGVCNGGFNNGATINVLGIGAKNGGGITFPADGRLYFTPGEFQYPGQSGAPNNSSIFQSTSPVSSGLQLWSIYYNGTTLYFNVNGTQNSASTGSYGMTSISATSSLIGFLDGALNGVTPPLPVFGTNGIGEIVFYNTDLTPSNNYQIVEGYLAWKWGLQGSLPGGHPYKNSAPTYTYGGTTYGWAPSINLVTTITDFSGNGVTVTQTGGTNLINSMNGLPGLSFIGNNWLTGSVTANALTAYVVYSMSSSAVSNARILSLGLAGTNDNVLRIGLWTNKSGFAGSQNLTAGGSLGPTYSADILTFGGPSSLSLGSSRDDTIGSSTWAMFFVINPDPTKASFVMGGEGNTVYYGTSGAHTNVLGIGARHPNYNDYQYPVDGYVYFNRFARQFYSVYQEDTFTLKSNSPVSSGLQIWSLYSNGPTVYFNVNGSQDTATGPYYNAAVDMSPYSGLVGYFGPAGGNKPVFGTNGIGEIVFYNTDLTPSNNYQTVEGYLAWKWGLQGSLPGGHPYKSSAPTYSGQPWAPRISGTNPIAGLVSWFDGKDGVTPSGKYANIIRSGSGPNIAYTNSSLTITATSTDNTVTMASLWLDSSTANLSTNATPESSTANTIVPAISNFAIGQNVNTSNSTPFNGYIGEVIVFNYVLTKIQRQQVEGYLTNKWKITVPALHPYYNIPILNRTFQPVDIPTCGLWLDSADLLSMTLGSTITQWNDKSGLGNNLTTGNSFSLARPSYNPATNIVTFGGSSNMSFAYNYYAISGAGGTNAWALFFVVNPDPTKSTFLMGAGNNAAPFDFYGGLLATNVLGIGAYSETSTAGGRNCSNPVYTGNGHVYFQSANNTGWGSAGGFFDSGASVSAGLQVWSLVYNGTNITLFINGTSFASVATSGTMLAASRLVNNTSNIGDWYDNSNPRLSNNASKGNASVGEMVFYNTNLVTSNNYQTVEGFLAWKWGLQGSLPEGHPYKNSAPTFSGQPWAPRITGTNTISGLVSWFDGKDPLALNLNPAPAVLTWNDKSGGGYNTRASGAPSLSNNGVTFNSGSMTLPTPAPYSQTSTIFMVANAKVLTGGGNDVNSTYYNGSIPYFGLNTYQSGGVLINGLVYMTSPFIFSYKIGYRSPSGVASGFDYPPLNPPTNLYCPITLVSVVKTNGVSALGYSNGTLSFTGGDDGSGTATSITNVGGDGLGFGLDGVTINEFILYNSALTLNQVRQVEAYLAWKWRLQALFPTTHPAYTLPSYGVVFTPKALPGCALWLDAADKATMTFSSGSNISTWNDKSGNANNFTTTSGTITVASDGAYPSVLIFPNSVAYMTSASSVTWTTSSSVFVVAKITDVVGGAAAQMVFDAPQTELGEYSIRYNSTGLFGGGQPSTDIGSSSTYFTNGTLGVTNSLATYQAYHIVDTVFSKEGTSVFTLSSPFQGNRYWYGTIAEVIMFTSALTSSQRQQVEGYLAHKWNLINSLPSSHGYIKITP